MTDFIELDERNLSILKRIDALGGRACILGQEGIGDDIEFSLNDLVPSSHYEFMTFQVYYLCHKCRYINLDTKRTMRPAFLLYTASVSESGRAYLKYKKEEEAKADIEIPDELHNLLQKINKSQNHRALINLTNTVQITKEIGDYSISQVEPLLRNGLINYVLFKDLHKVERQRLELLNKNFSCSKVPSFYFHDRKPSNEETGELFGTYKGSNFIYVEVTDRGHIYLEKKSLVLWSTIRLPLITSVIAAVISIISLIVSCIQTNTKNVEIEYLQATMSALVSSIDDPERSISPTMIPTETPIILSTEVVEESNSLL